MVERRNSGITGDLWNESKFFHHLIIHSIARQRTQYLVRHPFLIKKVPHSQSINNKLKIWRDANYKNRDLFHDRGISIKYNGSEDWERKRVSCGSWNAQ